MRVHRRALLFLTLALLSCPIAVRAATRLTPAVLARHGINMRMFSMVTFSYDGSVLVGVERVTDLKLKARGVGHLLRVFRWRGGRLVRLDTIPLPTTAFEQMALSADGTQAIVIGEGGSKFIQVNLAARQATVIWSHRRGIPGFRSELVAWWRNAAFYLLGYLHDAHDRMTFDGLVRLDPDRSGPAMFEPMLDIRPLQRKLRALLFEMYIDEHEAFLGVSRRPDLVDIYHYGNGTLTRLDEVTAVGGIASSPHRILYAARFEGSHRDVLLRDTSDGKVWHLGKDDLPYNYLFLSTTGRTAILTLMDFRGNTMSYYYARQADGFKVHPLPTLQDVRPGTLRLAPDGRVWAYYGPGGLIYGSVP